MAARAMAVDDFNTDIKAINPFLLKAFGIVIGFYTDTKPYPIVLLKPFLTGHELQVLRQAFHVSRCVALVARHARMRIYVTICIYVAAWRGGPH